MIELYQKIKMTRLGFLDLVNYFRNGQKFSFAQLLALEPNKTSIIAEGILTTRIPSKNDLLYYVEFEPGAELGEHWHDCIEIIHVHRGIAIIDGKRYSEGARVEIKEGKVHNVAADTAVQMFIEFYQ